MMTDAVPTDVRRVKQESKLKVGREFGTPCQSEFDDKL